MIETLTRLRNAGCWPVIAWRGNAWRAHINATGNFWAEADTPEDALSAAVQSWEAAGRPKDGYADT